MSSAHPFTTNAGQTTTPVHSFNENNDQGVAPAHAFTTNTGQTTTPTHPFNTNTGQTATTAHPFVAVGQTTAPSHSFVFTPGYPVAPAHSFVVDATQTTSPAFPFNTITCQNMAISRPSIENMIVSINRHKLSNDDTDWTTQFPLRKLRIPLVNPISVEQLVFSRLQGEIMENLRNDTEAEGLTIVWVMSTTNQFGIVRDNDSLKAAVLDHQHTGKHIVQLYVIRAKGDSTILPEYPVISSKTVNLPKYSFSQPQALSPIPASYSFQPLGPQPQQTRQQSSTPQGPSFSFTGPKGT